MDGRVPLRWTWPLVALIGIKQGCSSRRVVRLFAVMVGLVSERH